MTGIGQNGNSLEGVYNWNGKGPKQIGAKGENRQMHIYNYRAR